MPIYEYTCSSCKQKFEQLVRSMKAADEAVKCPAVRLGKDRAEPERLRGELGRGR